MHLIIIVMSFLFVTSRGFGVEFKSVHERWNRAPKKIILPIFWEKSVSDFRDGGVSTETEHYREQWVLRLEKGLGINLTSPRGQVPVSGLDYTAGPGKMPRKLVIHRANFALLFGVSIPGGYDVDAGVNGDPELVTISLEPSKMTEQRFDFGLNSDFYLQVQLSVMR